VTAVHVVTIREVGKRAVVACCHVVHENGNERLPQHRSVQVMHEPVAGDGLDPRYGHVVHTTPTGNPR
jgi:hypothetical protein